MRRALDAALADPRPSLIACRTIIGFGAPNKQGTSATHGAPLGADEIAAARTELGWTSEPFDIPADVAAAWAAFGAKGKALHAEWNDRHASNEKKSDFEARKIGRASGRESVCQYV